MIPGQTKQGLSHETDLEDKWNEMHSFPNTGLRVPPCVLSPENVHCRHIAKGLVMWLGPC